MKRINLKIISIYVLIFLYLTIYPALNIIFSAKIYYNVINPLFWLFIAGLAFLFSSNEHPRYKNKVDKIQTVVIAVILYLIVYFLSGLVFGYQYSPYSHDIGKILVNIWSYIPAFICQEYVRSILVNYTSRKKYILAIVTVLFVAVELNYTEIDKNFANMQTSFEYISSVLIPSVVKNSLFTYIATIAGFIPNIIYRSVIQIVFFITPIFPNLDWFGTALFEIITPSIVYFYMNYAQIKVEENVSRRRINRDNPLNILPIYAILIMFVGFVLGLFKNEPVAIVSNSMVPAFSRGDVVVVRKLDVDETDKLKVGDVLQYEADGRYIVHRIVKIKEDDNGAFTYITKGDNNNAPDSNPVTESQIRGVVKYVIPKIGYPSVWLNDMFSKR
ncbi:MAG TPA: signal peptidase I [Candidatus Pelethosoma merdigallinarum]|nr:signal peptidase I [Candidatus Pelethosoma merdigallinarum]